MRRTLLQSSKTAPKSAKLSRTAPPATSRSGDSEARVTVIGPTRRSSLSAGRALAGAKLETTDTSPGAKPGTAPATSR